MPDGSIANISPQHNSAMPESESLPSAAHSDFCRKMRIALMNGANSICEEKSFFKKKAQSSLNKPIFNNTDTTQMLIHISTRALIVIYL
jgi:hypothetical protein